MDYMPGAASLAAAHRGKVQNLCLAALREKHHGLPAESCILGLEKATKCHDAEQAKATGDQPHLAEYQDLGHPYRRDYALSPSLAWVLTMSPLQSQVFAGSDFIEADVTYNAATVLEYLMNVVTFNYTTMECK